MKGFLAVLVCSLLLSAPAWAQSATPTATPTPSFSAANCNFGQPYAYGCIFAGTTVPGNQPVSVVGTAFSDGASPTPNISGEFFYSVGTASGTVTGSFTASGGECTPLDDFGNFLFRWTAGVPEGFASLYAASPTGAYDFPFTEFPNLSTPQVAVRESAMSSGVVLVGTCN